MKKKLSLEQSIIKEIIEHCEDTLKEKFEGIYSPLGGSDNKEHYDGYYSGTYAVAGYILGIIERLTKQPSKNFLK